MVKLKKSTPATQSPASPRRPVPSEAARKEQRSAATFLARIDEYAAGLRRLRQDAFALPDATRRTVEAIARGESVLPDAAAHAMEAADALRSRLGWDFLAALKNAHDKPGGREA